MENIPRISTPANLQTNILLLGVLIGFGHCNSDYNKASSQLNEFAEKINQKLFPSEQSSASIIETLVWSPLSVYSVLDPLIDGAGGSTYSELKALLHSARANAVKREVSPEAGEINSLDLIDDQLGTTSTNASTEPEEGSKKTSSPGKCLKSATGIFISKDFKLNDDFSKKLFAKSGGENGLVDKSSVEIKSLDFSDNSKVLADKINNWINASTDGLIDAIIQPENFGKEMKMIIVNGVRFKGKWKSQFRPSDTKTGVFFGSQENTNVNMMFQRSTQDYKHFEKDGYEILKIGYADNDLKLLFILPKNHTRITNIMRSLSPPRIAHIIEQLEPTELDIYVPRFQVQSHVPIKDALMKAGLRTLFSRMEANLTRMLDYNIPCDNSSAEPTQLYLSDIVHKTVLEMNEEGTKAGAATAGFFVPLSGLINHRIQNFTLNRPFIFIIRDSESAIVFQGIIANIPGEPETGFGPSANASSPELKVLTRSNVNDTTAPGNAIEGLSAGNGKPVEGMRSKLGTGIAKNVASDANEIVFKAGLKTMPDRFQQPEPVHPEGIRFPLPGTANMSKKGYQARSKNNIQTLPLHGDKIGNRLRQIVKS